MLALGACSNNQSGGRPPAGGDAATAGAAGSPAPTQPAAATPSRIIRSRPSSYRPRPKPGAPHGPGFDMPLIELGGYTPARPMDVLRDAHMFTADHPEVASYVPCYCGCGNAGHKNNADCFVKGRDPQGRVTEWEPHGVACAVCIDIAVDSMKMRNSGASVTAIRKKVQSDYRPHFPNTETPTPAPPGQVTLPEPRADAFARLFEAVHEGVYIGLLGPRETTTLAANPHLKLMFGYAAEARDAQIRPFDALAFVDPQARAAFIERLASEGAVTDYLLRLRRVDNSPVWVEVTAHADPPAPDGSVRIDALVRDVSERKKLEDQTRDLYHQLLQAEKLAALGQTISGVAHELNNPLATILTWAERLSQRPAGEIDEKTKRGLETILSESERAAKIVRNLLTFARKRQSTRAMVDLNHVVRETLALRSYEQRITNITIVDALAAGLPQVFADAHQVQQVLLNLVINAEQAMLTANGRGTLVVRSWHDLERGADRPRDQR